MEKYYFKERVCVAWIFQLCLIFGYFGVSDTDTDVLLPLGVNVNFPPGSGASPSSSSSRNGANGKSEEDVNRSYNKLRMKRASTSEDRGMPHDEEMRLWDQIFSNALATSNTSQWIHLRQIFDRVEEELHKTKSTGNASLNQIHKIHPSLELPHQPTTFVGPLLPKTTLGSSKHPKFSYHRVSGLRGRGRPFAAVTLAIADEDSISKTVKTESVTPNADHTFSRDSKNDQESFSLDSDYQLDHHGGEHETLLNDDFKHFKNFDHSDSSSSHLLNKFESFQNFESFDGPSRRPVQMGVSGHHLVENYDQGSSRSVVDPEHRHLNHHHHHQEHKGRHHHHHSTAWKKTNHFHHLKNPESDAVDDSNIKTHHHHHRRSVRRKKNGKQPRDQHYHTQDDYADYQQDK